MQQLFAMQMQQVALLAEGVDRNSGLMEVLDRHMNVALLAEGVDRNTSSMAGNRLPSVALLAEGVDRNKKEWRWRQHGGKSPSSRRAWIEIGFKLAKATNANGSPSSRRAWIEIETKGIGRGQATVALLAEGVDRNPSMLNQALTKAGSPSSRRAWIEI